MSVFIDTHTPWVAMAQNLEQCSSDKRAVKLKTLRRDHSWRQHYHHKEERAALWFCQAVNKLKFPTPHSNLRSEIGGAS